MGWLELFFKKRVEEEIDFEQDVALHPNAQEEMIELTLDQAVEEVLRRLDSIEEKIDRLQW